MSVGGKLATKVMGIINASPESFYKGSVRTGEQEIAAAARQMQQEGVHIIDIGAMSTAPYLETMIPLEEETRRMPAICPSLWIRRAQLLQTKQWLLARTR